MNQRQLVLGTAGHIDHGKTALVRALTGQDTDRLPEEKARGITIELGFASLALEDGTRFAVVDVPGHERFVRTMVAGASGLDLVLLVVAADEGVMPQTREHLAICRLLGIEHGLVALNKSDLVDDEMRLLAEEEVRSALAGGPLADAPILPVSAQTGFGLEALRSELARLAAALPPRAGDDRPGRLYVDRVFEKRGFGVVVTGTWTGAGASLDESIGIEPGGRRARIRGIERHGEAIAATLPGARIALNLQGLATDAIHRGDLVCRSESLVATGCFDALLEWEASESLLEAPTSTELLVGTSERRARVAPIGEGPILPGERGFARVHVDGEPLHLLPGDRFVLRGFARDAGIGATIGGGRVLDVLPPQRRRSDPRLSLELETFAQGDFDESIRLRVERAGLAGVRREQLLHETGASGDALDATLARLAQVTQHASHPPLAQRPHPPQLVRLGADRWLASEAAARLRANLLEAVDAFHANAPLQPGMPRATLAGRLPPNVPAEVAAALVERAARAGELVIEEQLVRRSDFRTRLDAAQERLAKSLLETLRAAGLEAPALRAIEESLGADPARLRAIAHHLERQGELVAAPEELFFAREAVDALIARVVAHFATNPELDTQTFKALIGASRRTAMPLMALLDDLQITRRDGSLRRLLHDTPRFARARGPA